MLVEEQKLGTMTLGRVPPWYVNIHVIAVTWSCHGFCVWKALSRHFTTASQILLNEFLFI